MSDITCDNCGACCRHMVMPQFYDVQERREKTSCVIDRQLDNFERNVRPGLPEIWPCCWLDPMTMSCIHYEHRPELCRENNGEGCMPGNDACLGHRKHWATNVHNRGWPCRLTVDELISRLNVDFDHRCEAWQAVVTTRKAAGLDNESEGG